MMLLFIEYKAKPSSTWRNSLLAVYNKMWVTWKLSFYHNQMKRQWSRQVTLIDYLRRCESILNSAIDAAKAAGGSISPRSDIIPDIRMANSLGPSIEGVLGSENGSRIGGGSWNEDEDSVDMHRRHQSSIFLWNNISFSRFRMPL